MTRRSSIELPIINFSKLDLVPGGAEWDSTKKQVLEALEEFGFFEAVCDKVPLDFRAQFFASSKQVFDLPFETKIRNRSGRSSAHGYHEPITSLYESIAIEDAQILERTETFTDMMWPEGNASFCQTVHSYAHQVAVLEQLIKRMVLESLGVEKYVDELMKSTEYILRLNKYEPEPLQMDAKVGLIPHTDKTILSILSENQVNGLQIQTKDGQWLDAKLSPCSFAVFSGDILMAWTNGRVYSAEHVVMVTGGKTRYSVGLFSTPKAGYIVKAPEELVDEPHPRLFKPFEYVGLLAFCNTGVRYACKSSFAAYCGV